MDIEEIKSAVDSAVTPVMSAFEEFKATNDQRLAELESKGSSDPLVEEKLTRIEKTLSNYETLGQKLALAEQQAKAAREAVDRFEVAMARLPASAKSENNGERKVRFNSWLRAAIRSGVAGSYNLSVEEQKLLSDVAEESKALNVSNDTAGGYLAPVEYVREMIRLVTELSPVRSLVSVRSTAAKSIMMPKKLGQFSAQWVAELGTKSETTGYSFGLEEIPNHEMYALVDISNQMLEDSVFDMEAELRNDASEQFAVAEGIALLSGNGVGKPEGILSNSSVAHVHSGDANTITADSLMTLFYAIKAAYARNATWGMNRSTVAVIRKLKDGDGTYIWQPGLQLGQPNTILGASYVELPDMPSVSAGTYPVLWGDWRRAYTLVDRISMEFLRDPYTQATAGNVRFIFRKRLGGQVTNAEAIQKLYIAV